LDALAALCGDQALLSSTLCKPVKRADSPRRRAGTIGEDSKLSVPETSKNIGKIVCEKPP
jgi:hypothetical protein